MTTNADRLRALKTRLRRLNREIERKGREDEYIEMVEAIHRGGITFEPLDETTWSMLLPKERDKHLLRLYHTLRTELHLMIKELNDQSTPERIAKYLASPWVKIVVASAGLIKAALILADVLHQSGVFFNEEREDDPLFL